MNNLVQFLYVYIQNTWNFIQKIWEIAEEIITNALGRLVLILIMKQNSDGVYLNWTFIVFCKPKSSQLFAKFYAF